MKRLNVALAAIAALCVGSGAALAAAVTPPKTIAATWANLDPRVAALEARVAVAPAPTPAADPVMLRLVAAVEKLAAGAAAPAPAPVVVTPPVVTPPAPPAPTPVGLKPLTPPGALWDWNAEWQPANWSGGAHMFKDHAAKNITVRGTDVVLALTPDAQSELQRDDLLALASGSVEMDTTFPKMRDCLIAAPLWLYDGPSGDEIDFEVAGRKGLMINVHRKGQQVEPARYVLTGDLSGQRHKLKITWKAGEFVAFFVDGAEVARILPGDMPGGVGLPTAAMRTYATLWGYPAGGSWTGGTWVAPVAGDPPIEMLLHGFAQSAN